MQFCAACILIFAMNLACVHLDRRAMALRVCEYLYICRAQWLTSP